MNNPAYIAVAIIVLLVIVYFVWLAHEARNARREP